jgi:hypothetical protein
MLTVDLKIDGVWNSWIEGGLGTHLGDCRFLDSGEELFIMNTQGKGRLLYPDIIWICTLQLIPWNVFPLSDDQRRHMLLSSMGTPDKDLQIAL